MKRLHELDAYVTGELDDAAADAFEDALFDAPDDPDLAFVDRLARHGARLAAHGTFDMGVSKRHIDELIARGHRVQLIDGGGPGTKGPLELDAEAELIATRIELGRTDLERVDVEITIVDRGVTKTLRDVLVDPSEGAIYGLCEAPLALLAYGAGSTIARVRQRDAARTVIGEWHLLGPAAPLR